jgi:hypothetical protein
VEQRDLFEEHRDETEKSLKQMCDRPVEDDGRPLSRCGHRVVTVSCTEWVVSPELANSVVAPLVWHRTR